MIRLALSDLDDTLIANGLPRATDKALAAIHEMCEAGLRFGPVSGRVPNAMGWMFAGDVTCYQTAALANGQMIYLDGELVHTEAIATELLWQVVEVLLPYKDACLCIYDVTMAEDSSGFFVSSSPARIARAHEQFGHIRRDARTLEKPSYLKANIWCGGGRGVVTEVRDALRASIPALEFVFPSANAPLIDISPAGWNKGSAVAFLADALGLSLEEVATFGDSENDLSMIEGVPNSVAVANATDEVLRAARWHIGASADDAVADALSDIARAARAGSAPHFMGGTY